jgi:hypothetical protein
MHKLHFVSILFKKVHGTNYIFRGLVKARCENNGSYTIDINKLFRNAFKMELPAHTGIQFL